MPDYFRPRKGGGLVSVTFDSRAMLRLTNQTKAETQLIASASRLANERLAKELQNDIAFMLRESVRRRSRQQKNKPENQRLASVIKSPKNRRVNAAGFTVGYLNEFKSVAPYYRGLEVGTRVHVGRYLRGYFQQYDGQPSAGVKSYYGARGRDARFIQTGPFSTERPQFPGVKIKRRIQGYRYFEAGERRFENRGGSKGLALQKYTAAFREKKMPLIGATLSNVPLPRQSGSVGFGPDELAL